MSQSYGSTTDTQALLQSMLQRLKLQPGTESLGCLNQPSPTEAVSTWGQNGHTAAPDLQTVGRTNNIPVNGFGAVAAESSQTDGSTKEPKEEGRGGLINNAQKEHEMKRWDSREEYGIPALDSNFDQPANSPKDREGQQPNHGGRTDMGQETTAFPSSPSLISSPSYKDNIDSDRGENGGFGQAVSPVVTPTGQQLFPAESLKDADVTSLKGTENEIHGEKEGNGNSTMEKCIPSENFTVKDAVINYRDNRASPPDTSPLTSGTLGQSEGQDDTSTSVQGFTPRVYDWSLKTTETSPGTGSEEKKMLHLGNGGLGVSAQNNDMETVLASQRTVNGSSEKELKKPVFETKTKRWTHKIKERWQRRGSFGKKEKEVEGRTEMKNEEKVEFSPQSQPENLINMANMEGGKIPDSLDRSGPIDGPPTLSEGCAADSRIRSFSDFEFSLGPFSLMEEILTGQEWAKFLTPGLSAISTNQGPSEQPTSQLETTLTPQDSDGGKLSMIPYQPAGVNNQWNFSGNESSQVCGFGMAPVSTDNMDISEVNHIPEQNLQSEDNQSEPMEHSHVQSDMESEESGPKAQEAVSIKKPADVLDTLALRSRVLLNRKRVHHSQEKRGESLQAEEGEMRDRKEAETDESKSSPRTTTTHETEEVTEDSVLTLYPLKPSLPSPSSCTSPIRAPRGVLKHSISQDSESSLLMETVPKKRRVDEARRVRFSEKVVAIPPLELDPDDVDSEEDSGTEEDSTIEEEDGMEQAAMEEVVAPAPRAALPAWILALKKRKPGRKHRQ